MMHGTCAAAEIRHVLEKRKNIIWGKLNKGSMSRKEIIKRTHFLENLVTLKKI